MFTASENKHAVHVLRAAFINMNVNVVCDFLSKFLKQNEHTCEKKAVLKRCSWPFSEERRTFFSWVKIVIRYFNIYC